MANIPLSGKPAARQSRLSDVFATALRLGLTSFGGPVAHLGYFRREYVERKEWLTEQEYADIVALCQMLPGPASSQVGIAVGLQRAGRLGGIAAWLGFTLPSALALAIFAICLRGTDPSGWGWIHGLKLTAVAVVAQAVYGVARKLAATPMTAGIAVAAAALLLLIPSAVVQVAVIVLAALAGRLLLRRSTPPAADGEQPRDASPARASFGWLIAFAALLIALPLLRMAFPGDWLALADSFYRSGSLVFGGGHVVLPLLEREVVPNGWVSKETFLAGYGAAQAVPGPLFTFAAYLGGAIAEWRGALLATLAIFLPAYLLVAGALPLWQRLRRSPGLSGAMAGVNAAVVGILLAAWYQPIFVSAVAGPADFAVAAVLFAMLTVWKLPPWIAVAAGALLGQALLWLPLS